MVQDINDQIAEIYDTRFSKYGPTPEASMWFSERRQLARFEVILQQILQFANGNSVSISDIGCGYGAFLEYLLKNEAYKKYSYFGYDISCNVIEFCKKNFLNNGMFYRSASPKFATDFVIMSGTYNFFPNTCIKTWEYYFHDSLQHLWPKARSAMIFNLQISDESLITSSGIVYANKVEVVNFCEKNLGQTTLVRNAKIPSDLTFTITK